MNIHDIEKELKDIFTLYENKNIEECLTKIKLSRAIFSKNISILMLEAKCYYYLNQYEKTSLKLNEIDKISPFLEEVLTYKGLCYFKKRDFIRAKKTFKDALNRYSSPFLYINYAAVCYELGEFEEAFYYNLKKFEFADKRQVTLYNMALNALTFDALDKRFLWYEQRRLAYPNRHLHFNKPYWQGENIQNKTLLIYSDQGVGDAIQMARHFKLLHEKGVKLIILAIDVLRTFWQENFPYTQIIDLSCSVAFDFYCADMSLPFCIKTAWPDEEHPATFPYLTCTNKSTLPLLQELPLLYKDKQLVGFCFQGNPNHENDALRSLSDTDIQKLLNTLIEENKDIIFVCLQKNISQTLRNFLINKLIIFVGDNLETFSDTADLASMMNCIISVDTSIAHLSGAMGIKTLLLLPFRPDFRWELYEENTKLYPNTTLLRKNQLGDWNTTFTAINTFLKNKDITIPLRSNKNYLKKERVNKLIDIEKKWLEEYSQIIKINQMTIQEKVNELKILQDFFSFNNEVNFALIDILFQNKIIDEANIILESYSKETIKDPRYWIYKLAIAQSKIAYKEMTDIAEEAIKNGHHFELLYYQYGYALQNINNLEKALYAYKKALDFNKNNVGVLNNIGNIYFAINQTDLAIVHFEKVLTLMPQHLNAKSMLKKINS